MPTSRSGQSGPSAALGQGGQSLRRWLNEEDRGVVLMLVVLTLAGAAAVWAWDAVAPSVLMLPLLLTSLLLPPSRVPLLVGLVLAAAVVVTLAQLDEGFPVARWSTLVTAFAMGAVIMLTSYRRAVLGVAGMRGESMLIDLRDRISRQGDLPDLPETWYVDNGARSAGGSSFAGDFMVARLSDDGRYFAVAVVDVSGKGVDVGTKSLLLSGAFGGLLGALPAAGFLPAANEYLMRQDWSEGFATAVHLSVDLATGDFEIRGAGHPPAVQFFAGSGRWAVHDKVEGPVLGLVDEAKFVPVTGRLGPGDAILLYTDGLVETSRREISQGIDRLLGEGERLIRHGFEGAAQNLVNRLGSSNDDCALLVLQRRR